MIISNERLIVVLGMAHSGTTILTYILKQHPNIFCGTNGMESWIFENDWLPRENPVPIQELINKYPTKRILIKRPWNCVKHGKWMQDEMPNAKYLYCLRPFEEISVSWSKPTSFIDISLRNSSLEDKKTYYNMCYEKGIEFGLRVQFFKVINNLDFIKNPEQVISDLSNWLELTPFKFNLSQVSSTKNIKQFLLTKNNKKVF